MRHVTQMSLSTLDNYSNTEYWRNNASNGAYTNRTVKITDEEIKHLVLNTMEQLYPVQTDLPVFVVSNTTHHDQLQAYFRQGVHFLENQVEVLGTREAYPPSMFPTLTQNLLNIAKPLTIFLEFLMSLQSPVYNPKLRRLQRLKNTWLRKAIADLRIYCHRYSLAVLKISFDLEKQVKSFHQSIERNGDEIIDPMEEIQGPWNQKANTPAESFHSDTSMRSWTSCGISAESEMASPGSSSDIMNDS